MSPATIWCRRPWSERKRIRAARWWACPPLGQPGKVTSRYHVLASGFMLKAGDPPSGQSRSGPARRKVISALIAIVVRKDGPGRLSAMTEVTRILAAIEQGDAQVAGQLLPLVYTELRRLAAQKLSHEKPGLTLEATALVHEAYLRLVGDERGKGWDSRGHFFAAAAEAMRRILVENARRKRREKHGGGRLRVDLDERTMVGRMPPEDLLALDEALTKFASRGAGQGPIGAVTFLRRTEPGRGIPGDRSIGGNGQAILALREGLVAPRNGRRGRHGRLFGSRIGISPGRLIPFA